MPNEVDGGGSNDGSGGGRSLAAIFMDYVDADNPSLLGKIDFRRMIADASRSVVAAVTVGVAGVILKIGEAFGLAIGSVERAIFSVSEAVLTAPAEMQRIATDAAAEEIELLGFIALPVSVGFALLTLLAISATLYVFAGEDLF